MSERIHFPASLRRWRSRSLAVFYAASAAFAKSWPHVKFKNPFRFAFQRECLRCDILNTLNLEDTPKHTAPSRLRDREA